MNRGASRMATKRAAVLQQALKQTDRTWSATIASARKELTMATKAEARLVKTLQPSPAAVSATPSLRPAVVKPRTASNGAVPNVASLLRSAGVAMPKAHASVVETNTASPVESIDTTATPAQVEDVAAHASKKSTGAFALFVEATVAPDSVIAAGPVLCLEEALVRWQLLTAQERAHYGNLHADAQAAADLAKRSKQQQRNVRHISASSKMLCGSTSASTSATFAEFAKAEFAAVPQEYGMTLEEYMPVIEAKWAERQ